MRGVKDRAQGSGAAGFPVSGISERSRRAFLKINESCLFLTLIVDYVDNHYILWYIDLENTRKLQGPF